VSGLVLIFIGWPAILGSLFVSVIGIITNRPYLLAIGAVLVSGFAWYLIGSPVPVFYITGASLPLLHLVAMLFTDRGKKWVAAVFLLPHLIVASYFAAVV